MGSETMEEKASPIINDHLIERICSKIQNKGVVYEKFADKGLVYIDKLLPYLCIYRFKEEDTYFSGLLKTQGAYIIVEESIDLKPLLRAIATAMTEKFHSMLIMEFWPEISHSEYKFKIRAPKGDSLPTTKALAEGFKELSQFHIKITNKISKRKPRHPEHLQPLLEDGELKKLGAILYGIGIPTIYRNEQDKELYYLFYRRFHSVFSETVMRSAYEFIRVQTANPFDNYLMLGKTSIDEITLKADKELAEISEGMSFLLRTTPVNSYEEWIKFKENNYKKTPSFNYRLIAIDPELEKRKLFNIPIEEIEDPTIAFILRGKRLEIEKQLTMLEERGTSNFKHVGNSLYGVIQRNTLKEAKKILRTFPRKQNLSGNKRYDCYEFAKIAQKEIDYYQEYFPEIPLKIEIRDDIAGIMVSKSKLLISSQLSINSKRADALIQHEVGTHIVTYCNGKSQPLQQMYAGFEGYDQLQEGIAVLAEYLVDGLTVTRLRLLAGRVVAVDSMVKGATFKETFKILNKTHNFSPTSAYYITMRVYRGGGLTKDAVYLAGLIDVLNYLKKGGDLDILYCGKFNTNHIELIEELLYRKVLKQPKIPRFLERPQVQQRLARLRNGIEITDMVSS